MNTVSIERIEETVRHDNVVIYWLLILTLFVVWMPLAAPSYILPLVVMLGYGICSGRANVIASIFFTVMFLLILCLLWSSIYGYFYWRGAAVSFISYSGLIFFFLCPDLRISWSPRFRNKIGTLLASVTLAEAWLGIVQAVYGAFVGGGFDLNNGDWVKGTIGIGLSGFEKGANFGNPMFACNIVFGALGAWALCGKKRLIRMCLVSAFIAFVLASVMHLIIALLVALISAIIVLFRMNKAMFRRVGIAIFIIAFVSFAVMATLPQNVKSGFNIVESTIVGTTPKMIIAERSFDAIPSKYPLQPLLGLGLGQFSSIGALIATGQYFGSPVHPDRIYLLPHHLTQPQRYFFYDQWFRWASNAKVLGSSQVPYVFWLSIYVEFGGAAIILMGWCLIRKARMVKVRLKDGRMTGRSALSVVIIVAFFIISNFQIDYFGIPQASFLGIFVAKILGSYA